jgi:hypothetical protein
VNLECSERYATLKPLYQAWAESCEELSFTLHSLMAREDEERPAIVRLCFVDEELAAVRAHTTARRIYLESLG